MRLRLSFILPIAFAIFTICSLSIFSSSAQSTSKKRSEVVGDDSPARKANLEGPVALAFDKDDNLFIVEGLANRFQGNRIRRVNIRTGIITTIAGSGKAAFSGDGDLATKASLKYPTAIAIDPTGNIFIAEIGGRVRRIDAQTGIIATIAGNGELGHEGTGDGGPAILASFRRPRGLAFDKDGNLLITDDMDHRIRRVAAKTGIITTVAGGGPNILGDGSSAIAAGFAFPQGIVVDQRGNIFIADYEHHRIRRIDAQTNIISTIAGTGEDDRSGDGGPAIAASLRYPSDLAIDKEGNLFISDERGGRVRRIDAKTSIITTVAGTGKQGLSGDGGPATEALLVNPSGLAVDSQGNLFIAEFGADRIRRVDAKTGIITTVVGNGHPPR